MSTPQPPGVPDQPAAAPPPAGAAAPGTAAPPVPPAPPTVEEEDRPSTWQPLLYLRLAVLLIAIGYSVAFVAKNTRQIPIDFVFATASVHLIWEILLLLAVGIVGGIVISQLYRHRRRAQLAKKAGKHGRPGADVGGRREAVRKPG